MAAAGDRVGRHPLVDGHNDRPWTRRVADELDLDKTDLAAPVASTQTDLPRLARGGVGAQFWSVFVPADLAGETAVTTTLEQVDLVHEMIRRYPDALELALTAADVERINAAGRLASLIGAKGGHSIGCSLGTHPPLSAHGVRDWEREFEAEMKRRGFDDKNVAARGRLRAEREEWMASHPRPEAALAEVAEHVERVREIAGVDHVGIGSDYDGIDWLPEGLEDASCYPALFAELAGSGWSEEECGKLARGNILRALREAEAASRRISPRRGPSRARIEDLDQS